jgi:hypothetical protein
MGLGAVEFRHAQVIYCYIITSQLGVVREDSSGRVLLKTHN